nr:immunoglobulin light chain junction region [Mus musculus]
CQQYSSYMYTF